MKFIRETSGANVVTAYEPGLIRVNQSSFDCNIIISPERIIEGWEAPQARNISMEELQIVLELQPEIVILGTGNELVFPNDDIYGQLATRGIGLEVMATAAASRTYNVLAHEGRPVVAALVNR